MLTSLAPSSSAHPQLDKRGATLDDKIKRLDAELAKHRDLIRRARMGLAQEAAKRRALTVLKQKRLYESQREQLYSQQFNVEQVSFAAQSAKDTAVQVAAMQHANKDLKAQFKTKAFDLNAIDRMNDEMADLMAMSEEIQETLGRSYNVPDEIDEGGALGRVDASGSRHGAGRGGGRGAELPAGRGAAGRAGRRGGAASGGARRAHREYTDLGAEDHGVVKYTACGGKKIR